MRTALLTIAVPAAVAQARALHRVAERLHPEVDRYLEVTGAESFALPQDPWFRFQYNPYEYQRAIKPYAIQGLLDKGYEQVLYLHWDCALAGSWTHVLRGSITLAPHLPTPLQDDLVPTELDFRRMGAYTSAFLAVRNDVHGRSFVAWWRDKCLRHCLADVESGMFVDQAWLDLVPGLFEGVEIVRDPGVNVGFSSLPLRPVRHGNEDWTAGGDRLVFWHLGNLNPEQMALNPRMTRVSMDTLHPDERAFLDAWSLDVLAEGYVATKLQPSPFARFSDDVAIPDTWRRIGHAAPEMRNLYPDPFDARQRDAMYRVAREHADLRRFAEALESALS